MSCLSPRFVDMFVDNMELSEKVTPDISHDILLITSLIAVLSLTKRGYPQIVWAL